MTEEEKNQRFNEMLELNEILDVHIAGLIAFRTYDLHELTLDKWVAMQTVARGCEELLSLLKNGLGEAGKIVGNDAAFAHLQAVISSDD